MFLKTEPNKRELCRILLHKWPNYYHNFFCGPKQSFWKGVKTIFFWGGGPIFFLCQIFLEGATIFVVVGGIAVGLKKTPEFKYIYKCVISCSHTIFLSLEVKRCAKTRSQLFQSLGELWRFYDGKWFSSHRFGFKSSGKLKFGLNTHMT